MLGEHTKVHTPYNQFKNKIFNYNELKKRFDKEVVTEEFFQNYKRLYLDLIEDLAIDKKFNQKLLNYFNKNLIIFAFDDNSIKIKKESIIPFSSRKVLYE